MMNLIASILPSIPVQACEHMAGRMGMHHGMGMASQALGGLATAGTAALGYLIVHLAGKESGRTKLAGQVAGWIFVVGGTLGFLCGVANHVRMLGAGTCCKTAPAVVEETRVERSMASELPPGHPPVGQESPKPRKK